MALQLKSKCIGSATGVRQTPVQLITIPYNSVDINAPITAVVRCIGSTIVSGSVRRVFFVLPIIWYGNGADQLSVPYEYDALNYTSSAFSHLEIADGITGGALSAFTVTPNPQYPSGDLIIDITAPNTSTDWEFYAYADIYKEI